MRWVVWSSFLTGVSIFLALLPGCSSGFPKTYPSKGKVVFKGGKAVKGGVVELESVKDPTMRAIGDIEEDGTFTLIAFKDGKEQKGAVEGEYKVFVEFARGEQEDSRRQRIAVAGTKTIKAGANELLIELDLPGRK